MHVGEGLMDTRRLERLVIIILAILVLCLLGVVALDRLQSLNDRREMSALLTALLEDNGIRADDLTLPETPALYRLMRDADREKAQMKTLIGTDQAQEQGGGIRYYKSARGQAILRATGEMDLLFVGDAAGRGEPGRAVDRLFARAGLPLAVSEREPDDENTLMRCCLWDGIPILNAVLKVDITGGTASLITGTIPFQKESEHSTEGVMNAATAIGRFLEQIRREGIVCSRLEEIAPVYLMSVTVGGEGSLTPLWRIRTDTGTFYLNAVTGRAENPV